MRIFLLSTLLLVFGFSHTAMAKVVKRHYADGTLEAIVHYNKKGQKHGVYKTFWPNGNLKEVGIYKNGELQASTIKQYSIDGGSCINC